MSQLLSYVRKLNIFQTKDEDKHEYKNTLISTRIYFILMILILLGLILSLSVIPQMTTITINSPTYEQMKTFPLNVQCICSRLSIRYGTFLTLTTNFHQICSSDFITHRWIKTIYSGRNSTHFYSGDFREIGSSQFQSLSSLCFLSRTNLEDNLNSFYDTSLINSQLIFENLLQTTIKSSIEQLKMILPVSFKSQLNLMNKLIFGNQFLSGLKTILSIKYFHENQTSDFFVNYLIYQNSTSCLNDYNIVTPSGFYNIQSTDEQMNLLFEIPGFRSGCLPINSLLQSTLECFYNQTCINIILSYYSTSETFQSLNPLQSSIFTKEMTIQSMLNQMMIEELILNVSYENYFHQCAPISCSYSINQRNNFLMILIQLISLLSGLKLILENLIPNFIRFLRKPKIQSSKPKISFSMQFIQLKSNVKTRLIELNLFQNENDPHNRSHRIGTRFYIFILLISLTSLTIYSSIVKELTHEIISNPTEFVYNELYQKYSTNLNCPCSSLSIIHNEFLSIEPIYDEICSSEFLSSTWINYLFENERNDHYFLSNFNTTRTNLGTQMNILRTLCNYSKEMTDENLYVFHQTKLISSQILSKNEFNLQIDNLIQQWKINMINGCQRVINLVRITNQGNKYLNNFYNFYLLLNDKTTNQMNFISRNYSNCSCDLSESCAQKMFSSSSSSFFIGCSSFESLLQGTLQCYYNRTCVNEIIEQIGNGFDYLTNISLLINKNNEKIESVINRVMINSLKTNISFSSYYKKCSPNYCTIEQISRRSIFVILIIVLGILGGLSTGLKILFLIGIKFLEKINQNRSNMSFGKSFIKSLVYPNENQIKSRLHCILLIILMIIFYLITFLSPQLTIVQINSPTLSVYQDFLNKKSSFNSIQCLCSQISFEYETFLSIQPNFHSICSSDFISNPWIEYIYQTNHFQYMNFQFLSSFCQISQRTINDSLLQFLSTNFIDSHLSSSDILMNQMEILIQEFHLRISKSFFTTFNLLREVTENNQLISGYATNWVYEINENQTYLHTLPIMYDQCDCGLSSKCTKSLNETKIGCYPLESFLQTTFQCFYNQQCIDTNKIFKALNYSTSRFHINLTIESILQELMLENYSFELSYEKYFNQCLPSVCTYSYIGYRNIIDIITFLIGLYGGLMILSQWLTVFLLEIYKCRIQQIHPDTE